MSNRNARPSGQPSARAVGTPGARAAIVVVAIALGVLAGTAAEATESGAGAGDGLDAAAVGVGLGRTFDTWNGDGGLVVPLTLSLDEDRWEAALLRLTGVQRDRPWPGITRVLAEPYWSATGQRRWTFVRGTGWRAFVGVGAEYKNSANEISASHWNFAESLGARVAMPATGLGLEFAVRHWSNAGLARPNYGQNLVTLLVLWHPFGE